ncbi:formiminoglutamate deiminase [Murinocardiopsis flavida]|uniref:Formiminoglutamate deiminase n=1 Tax=Murinocardiopsis flavida TaxID=645275 RepID=A0A2P8DHW5_9ACTN|nr:formimidoylglutamate deiminase [Murinocardiopsis flavida]PSK96803.1 formiminoglutamate deiminase [Murinocardiopsis flavida]
MALTARYWCEWALLDTASSAAAATPGVLLDVADGRITAIGARAAPPDGAERLAGLTVPGFANAHSHAFHRALRGRTGEHGGSFWTWRERMYRAAARLDPDSYYRLARGVYAEMALSGVTAVGEFHYLHHAPGGVRYADPNAMSAALVAAAADAGIRITLLDTCYLKGGLTADGAHTPLEGTQLRFGDRDVDDWAARVDAFRPDGAHARKGAALHSVRAVPAEGVRRFVELHEQSADDTWTGPHIHLSEQPAENAACVAAYGRTPTGLLADTGFLDAVHPTLVHATHLGDDDVRLLRDAGSTVTVCLCPTTERDLADGLPRLADLEPVPVSLGSDGHSTIDMFEEARAVEMHERLRTGTRGTRGSPWLLEALHGHGHGNSLGWERAGWFAEGYRADLVTIGLDGVRTAGFDPERATDTAVFAATAADVRHVMADGRWIVRDGVHRSMPDAPASLHAEIKELFA